MDGIDAPGTPALPAMSVFIEAPVAATVGHIEVEVLETRSLGVHRLGATAADHPADSAPPPAVPLSARVESSAEPCPGALVTFAGRGAMRG
jgi:hypothetical protein